MPTDIFDTAAAVLEVLRRDRLEWSRSPDAAAQVQRAVARAELEAAQPPSAVHPAPSFCFRPLATAPVTHVAFAPAGVRPTHRARANAALADCSQRPRTGSAGHSAVDARDAVLPGRLRKPRGSGPVPDSGERLRALSSEAVGEEAPGAGSAAPTSAGVVARWETRLRRLPPAAQRLYYEMEARGSHSRTEAASSTAGVLWQRRAACPRDAELRRAVVDYLYRLHILSTYFNVPADSAEPSGDGPSAAGAREAFADAVMNGAALCQLIATLLTGGNGAAPTRDAVPCRCPRTLGEVRLNYAAALAALREAHAGARESIPAAAWAITVEEVYVRAAPTALLELYVHLISTYLPSPEELPAWRPLLCWQPPADTPRSIPTRAAELTEAEAECCAFLHACGALPDAAVYGLPGPECLIPSPVAAPFIASWKACVARSDVPRCLLQPSVWPYLCSGVALVALARRCGVEAAALARHAGGTGAVFENPRTVSCCLANITHAFRSFQAVSGLRSSLDFFTAESAAAVLRGDRVHVVSLLLHLREIVSGSTRLRRAWLPRKVRMGGTGDEREGDASPSRPHVTGTPPSSGGSIAGAAHSSDTAGRVTSSPPITASARTPATVAKAGVSHRSPASDRPAAAGPPSAQPSNFRRVAAARAGKENAAPSSPSRTEASSAAASKPDLVGWLCCVLGPDFSYAPSDGSFVFAARDAALSQPCWIFSDGVLLAHLIGILECRRCDFLDCVQPAVRRAAKLFNVRRCLAFLRDSAGVVWETPLLDESLSAGDLDGVLALLQALRSHYGMARRISVLQPEGSGAAVALSV